MMLAFPATASAAPIANPPPGSTRVQIFTVPVNATFLIPANVGFCPFAVTVSLTGWARFHVRFDQAGDFAAGIETRNIVFTYTANGQSVSDLMTLAQKAEDYVENSDGTVTAIYTFAGHASLIPGVGADVGHITFQLTFDPTTGQELNFEILEHTGQLGGLWSEDQQTTIAVCGQLAP